MSERILGTCSICGGAVTVPATWLGIHPPSPSCISCGATPVQPYGPVIPMRPRQPSWSPAWQWQRTSPQWQPVMPPEYVYDPPVPLTPSVQPDETGLPVDWARRHTTIC